MRISPTALLLPLLALVGPGEAVQGVIQATVYGLIGSPLYHKESTVKLDPYVAKRRNPAFEAVHGHKAVHLIERFGLGMDGREAQRLEQQRIRDAAIPYEEQYLKLNAPQYY